MNNLELRKKLVEYKNANKECERIKQHLIEVESDLFSVGGNKFSDIPSSTRERATIEIALDRKQQVEDKLKVAITHKYEAYDRVMNLINLVSNSEHKNMLIEYYINDLSYHKIAKKYYVSSEYVHVCFNRCFKSIKNVNLQ